jgi:coenzyme F420-reducing hydrogenase alpha subunit
VAQLVEIAHSVRESQRLLNEVLAAGLKDEPLVMPSVYGHGAGTTEAPRGILFHEYAYDRDGMCTLGNCIIPTNQNHGNIQKDFEKLLSKLLKAERTEKEIELGLEMLVWAYDLCISCSTRYLDVEFKRQD